MSPGHVWTAPLRHVWTAPLLPSVVDKSFPVGLGDEQRLTQVLLNLVNAIKFTDTSEVIIAAGARTGHFAVSVTDTGPGIPLDQQDRIFEQFQRTRTRAA